jgi:hypothetical protein
LDYSFDCRAAANHYGCVSIVVDSHQDLCLVDLTW